MRETIMAYRDDILALNPDHYWTFDNTHNDIGVSSQAPKNTNQAGGNTALFDATAITEDSSHSLRIATDTQRTECADSTLINRGTQAYRTFGGWFMPSEIARPPSCIYKEGGGQNNMAVFLGFGNTLLSQSVDREDHDIQCFSDKPLRPFRPYNYICRFKASDTTAANNGVFEHFVDGVLQVVTDGNPFDTLQMASHSGDINWGFPDVNLNVGGVSTVFAGAKGFHAHFASWTRLLTDQEIREILFERGALAALTIQSDTVANMQAQLDQIANTERADAPIAIRVEQATDATDFELIANNIRFHTDCSVDVQYTGDHHFVWVNTNGSNASRVSNKGGW